MFLSKYKTKSLVGTDKEFIPITNLKYKSTIQAIRCSIGEAGALSQRCVAMATQLVATLGIDAITDINCFTAANHERFGNRQPGANLLLLNPQGYSCHIMVKQIGW